MLFIFSCWNCFYFRKIKLSNKVNKITNEKKKIKIKINTTNFSDNCSHDFISDLKNILKEIKQS